MQRPTRVIFPSGIRFYSSDDGRYVTIVGDKDNTGSIRIDAAEARAIATHVLRDWVLNDYGTCSAEMLQEVVLGSNVEAIAPLRTLEQMTYDDAMALYGATPMRLSEIGRYGYISYKYTDAERTITAVQKNTKDDLFFQTELNAQEEYLLRNIDDLVSVDVRGSNGQARISYVSDDIKKNPVG